MDRNRILEIIIAQLRESVPDLGARPVTGRDCMADLGADSVERSEVLMSTLETLGLDLPMVRLHGAGTLGDLANLFHDELSRS